MSDEARSRLPAIATGLAVVAVTCAVAAVVVTLSRGRDERVARLQERADAVRADGAPAMPSLIERRVDESEASKLRSPGSVEVVANGVRVKDQALASVLGLEAGDVLTGLSGRQLASEL